jgi:hypothetical protein
VRLFTELPDTHVMGHDFFLRDPGELVVLGHGDDLNPRAFGDLSRAGPETAAYQGQIEEDRAQ